MKPDELRALADDVEIGGSIYEVDAQEKLFARFFGLPRPRPYTTNLQDAVDAVPEGWGWEIVFLGGGARAEVYPDGLWAVQVDVPFLGESTNPAAALCAAILRAKAAEMEGE